MHNELGNIYTHGKSRSELCIAFVFNWWCFFQKTLKKVVLTVTELPQNIFLQLNT